MDRGTQREKKLRQIARRKGGVKMSLVEARAQDEGAKRSQREVATWFRTWFEAWRLVKTWATEEELKVRPFGQSWADVWIRTEAEVWAQTWAQEEGQGLKKGLARMGGLVEAANLALVSRVEKAQAVAEAQAEMRGEAAAVAEALALAGVWVWARSEAHARSESIPSGLAHSSTIWRILSNHHRYWATRDLWLYSRETREDYSCITHFIAPITCLPFELLHQILLIIIAEASGPPLVLMLVCKRWHAVVTSIWASLRLGTRTSIDAVKRKLERNQWLDIVVDTDSDRADVTPSDGLFGAIFAAIEASSRWRSLVVESFPAQADLDADVVNRGLQQCPNLTMNRFTSFKFKSACETSPLLDGLLRILGTTARELATVEINSANVISSLAPAYLSIFHSVKVLSLDTPGILNPVDLLPHLHQLKTFNASHIPFPSYNDDVNLPFVHTLRHLSLRAVSIQWMSGRTFHLLEHCTLIFPLHHHVLHTFSTTLPNCKHFTFQGYPLSILGGVSAHKLSHLSVTCSGSSNGRGNQQLVQLSRQVLGESRLHPQILHISIEASNQAWVNALVFMSSLEELVIHNARPSSLGAKVFQSLMVQPVSASHPGAISIHGDLAAPLCPSLRRFGLKYDRWLRPSEQFDLIPAFVSIIRSRQQSIYSLESFRVWTTRDKQYPLELIERSLTSVYGFRRLAEESGIKGDVLGYGIHPGSSETSANSYSHSPATQMRRVLQSFRNRRLG